MADRYADAVRARRRELRELRAHLVGGHRGELRSCLALSRLAAAGHAAAALAELRHQTAAHVRRGDRRVRERLPQQLGPAVAAIAAAVGEQWATALGPPLHRIATERGLAMDPGWLRLPASRAPVVRLPAEPLEPPRSVLAGVVEGAALWRLVVVPMAALPLFGLPALAGPALAPLAVGTAATAVAIATRARRTVADRVRLHRTVEYVVGAAAAAIDADLDRRIVELESRVSAALDAAVLRRRAAVDHELALLASEPAGGADD
jgi:hypothetical protein